MNLSTREVIILGIAAVVALGLWISPFRPGAKIKDHPAALFVDTSSVLVPAHTLPADMVRVKVTTKTSAADLTIPEDGWITSFGPTAVNGAPEAALRFLWLFDTSQDDPYCEENPRVVFVMSFEKVLEMNFPPEYGYFVAKGTKMHVFGGFANFSDTDYPAASFNARIGFIPKSAQRELNEVYPLFLNAKCDSLFAVPPKATNFTRALFKPFIIPFDGRMVQIGTHSHKYATEMLLTLNGQELWRTSPIHLPDGTNLGNPIFKYPFNGVSVKKGDVLNFSVTYSNPLDRNTDAMASTYIQIVKTPKPETLPKVQ